ncbi:MAG: ImmA/IrrE family metallo-endopeptidase [Planctomycetes bacterium]|nr:ImmA/IrrE family metallo-endopeptidase [Planctomycetota bacterium]
MLPKIAIEEWSKALDGCVINMLVQQGMEGPPIDAIQLAAGLGMDIAWDAAQPGRARIVKLSRATGGTAQHAVLVRPEPRPERIQWAVAHEIGESLANQVFTELGVDPREARADAREQVANQLAVRILLPGAWFVADAAECNCDLPKLKERYFTASHELIARRMLDFPSAAVITIYDQGEVKFHRAAVGSRCGALRPIESTCWRMVHESGRYAQRSDASCVVRGWPIHEPEWKREILRLEWREDLEEL